MTENHEKSQNEAEKRFDRRVEDDRLIEDAKSKPGELPNRDEDEFSDEGLKKPSDKTRAENEVKEKESN